MSELQSAMEALTTKVEENTAETRALTEMMVRFADRMQVVGLHDGSRAPIDRLVLMNDDDRMTLSSGIRDREGKEAIEEHEERRRRWYDAHVGRIALWGGLITGVVLALSSVATLIILVTQKH